jgi:dimethylaniline monooxygenase (N-oxide forming)
MQARALARVLAGKVQLPSPAAMHAVAARDRMMDLEQYCRDAPRVGALGDYATYMNSWAEMIGCQPQLLRLFLTDPRLWWRVLCGQQNALQFRLHGPGAMFEQSREALMRMPMMPFPVLFVEVVVGFVCKSLSLFGLRSFDLIGM